MKAGFDLEQMARDDSLENAEQALERPVRELERLRPGLDKLTKGQPGRPEGGRGFPLRRGIAAGWG